MACMHGFAGLGRGVLVVDYDNNGFMDTLMFNHYGDHHVYRNHGGNGNGKRCWTCVLLYLRGFGPVYRETCGGFGPVYR